MQTITKDLKIYHGVTNYGFALDNVLIFDVGLNVGNKSEAFLERGAKVVGFEPQKECFIKAVDRLSKFDNFTAENVALSNKNGKSEIYISDAHTLTSMSKKFIQTVSGTRFSNHVWRDYNEKITTTTLDNMITKYGKPKYIKIDVEGYEFEVLQGLSQPIEYISIEYTPELYQNAELCINYLDQLYKKQCLYNYIYRENDHYMFSEWLDTTQIQTYLSSVKDYTYEFGDIFIKLI